MNIRDINKNIFRGYDIRGVYPTDLNAYVAYTIGKSYGTHIKSLGKNKCVIGYDNRYSSVELTDNLIKGILETGVNVVKLGLVTTPMYYYACIKLEIPSGIMVTASHNPKDDNGFKMAFDERGNARGEMIEEFRDFTLKGEFANGTGTLSEYDIKLEYLELMKNSITMGNRKLKVIVDLANATTTCVAPEILSLFPNLDFEIMYGDSDSSFPNHHPDPCVEENLEALKKRVLETKADLGIGYDGDGDRVGFIDESGNYIATDKFMIIVVRDLINKVENKKFLYDVKCSKSLEDEIRRLGAEPICYRVGNSYTKAAVIDNKLPFGGELSGHVYFNDKFPGFDSGIYASLRMMEILSNTDKNASELLEGINNYYSTPELKFASPDEKKNGVVFEIENYCLGRGYDILTIDGIRVTFEDGWALVRVSNTGPNITARFEATTKERLESIKDEFVGAIELFNK